MCLYFGCARSVNKIRWFIFGIFAAAGFLLILAGGNIITRCDAKQEAYNDYHNTKESGGKIFNGCLSSQNKHLPYLILGIVSFAIASIPIFVMCCCTENPDEDENEKEVKAPLVQERV
eukprot:TRINITY_DN280_c22_g1_i1.p2 TRINITY_DN280_c22_g1~~TRINITY_DN280_c22_g1_i1.p2  ORF type:complete len:118 (-),score=12.08 TRINITY_DN280_c22_g1_i1:221-574(-)